MRDSLITAAIYVIVVVPFIFFGVGLFLFFKNRRRERREWQEWKDRQRHRRDRWEFIREKATQN